MNKPYSLDEQVGFLLRQATQRHVGIFAKLISADLTPPQFSALVILFQNGACSQNELGRRIATDGATIKGIIDRLTKRGLTQSAADPEDGRMLTVSLTEAGTHLAAACVIVGGQISAATLAPLNTREQQVFLRLLKRLC
jgi:DNA-binding MarR family transcriptional regulator